MGLSSAVGWWEEWQLRVLVLVLCSLFIQYLLYFSIWVRRAPILRKFRVLVWIAYIGGDAVAIYALATLFNRQKQTWDRESSALEVLWAPFLLIHLGGQTTISAYSLEDNELWKRHTVTLVSQVTVALYVFCKWWSGEKTLLAAAILLFVLGIIKFTQNPWALRTASFNSMQTSFMVSLESSPLIEGHTYSMEKYLQEAKKCVLETKIAGLVRRHVKDGWKKYIDDAASYRRFSELRGQWALRRHHQLGWSLKKPFDDSVLIWHITTDLCFYHPNTTPQCRQGEATQRSREISNYMIYLLLICPEMLMHGTRLDLFTLASNQIIKNSKGPLDMTEEILANEILNMPTFPTADDMLPNARKLAEVVMELDNGEERWTVIQGVWVEMISYSACRCRGYLHAKSLGDRVECLTTIWLLLSFMGMETVADRHQRSDSPLEEEEEPWISHSQGGSNRSAENLSPV